MSEVTFNSYAIAPGLAAPTCTVAVAESQLLTVNVNAMSRDAGDLILVMAMGFHDNAINSATGYTLVEYTENDEGGGDVWKSALFRRTATDDASDNFNTGAGGTTTAYVYAAILKAAASTFTASEGSVATSTPVQAPSVNSPASGFDLLIAGAVSTGTPTTSTPSGFTLLSNSHDADNGTTVNADFSIYHRPTSSGATGTTDVTFSGLRGGTFRLVLTP